MIPFKYAQSNSFLCRLLIFTVPGLGGDGVKGGNRSAEIAAGQAGGGGQLFETGQYRVNYLQPYLYGQGGDAGGKRKY